MTPTDLYEEDFYQWTVRIARLLRSGRAGEADLTHIAEEIEDLGKRERRELLHRLTILMAHLLRWKLQPGRRSRSWELTIRVQRKDLGKLLAENPSLQPYLEKNLPEAYEHAAVDAMTETGHPESDFPSTCPFTLDVILDPDFPGAVFGHQVPLSHYRPGAARDCARLRDAVASAARTANGSNCRSALLNISI